MSAIKTIVIIARQNAWQEALKVGEYVQSTIDSTLAEVGFIHCSFPYQTLEIANRKFSSQDNLLLLLIDVDKVKPSIKNEGALSGRSGVFPHIYGPLNIDAVYTVVPLKKNNKGEFIQPEEVSQLLNDF